MPRVSHTEYELLFPDEEEDTMFFDSKDEAIRTARRYRDEGVSVELNASTKTWSHEAAVGHLAPIDQKDRPVRFTKSIHADSDIDLQPTQEMADNAARGLELREKHGKGGTAVGVARARDIKNRKNLSPETVKRMHSFFSRHEGNQSGGEDDAGYIAWLLWGGDAGKSWAARKSKQIDNRSNNAMSGTTKFRFGQVTQLLDTIESQSGSQRDLAKSNLRKLAERIADIDHTRDEWDRYVRIAKNLGYTESQIAGFSRTGAKANLFTGPGKSDPRRLIGVYDARGNWIRDMKTEKDARDYVERKKTASRTGAKADFGNPLLGGALQKARHLGLLSKDLIAALSSEDKDEAQRIVSGMRYMVENISTHIKAFMSRPKAKAKFDEHWKPQYKDQATKILAEIAKLIPKYESRRKEIRDAIFDLQTANNLAHDALSRESTAALDRAIEYKQKADLVRSSFSRPGPKAKASFEKSDDLAKILMRPVTVANCKQMMKVASEAIAWAKSVGDDDLLELAEVVGQECLAIKSRASRKDGR